MSKPFIKSADTSTSVSNSRSEIEKMLRRYGAHSLSVGQDYQRGTVVVSFIVPNTPTKDSQAIPIRLPVSVRAVYDRLYGQPQRWLVDPETNKGRYAHNPNGYDTKKLEQAERVAWRHLVLWIDAALTSAQAGLQTMTEAFLAHAVIPSETGAPVRVMDYLEAAQGQLAPGVRGLLAAPAETEP